MRFRANLVLWVGLIVLGIAASGCGAGSDPNTDELSIGAYSVVHEVLRDGILPAFGAEWKKKTGRSVKFNDSYNGSGAQARAIASGLGSDIAILSHEGDMEVLVKRTGSSRRGRMAPIGNDHQQPGGDRTPIRESEGDQGLV